MKRISLFLIVVLLVVTFTGIAMAEQASGVDSETPCATIEEAVTQFLQAEMARQAEQASNGWQRFIYEQGANEIQMDLEKFDIGKGKPLSVSFLLASGQPDVKTLGAYKGDAEGWLGKMQTAMLEHDTTTKTSLSITTQSGGYVAAFAPKAEASLQKSIKTLAANTQKAFANKTILTAITDYLMPTPIAVPKKTPTTFSPNEYAPAFTAYLERNSLDLDVNGYLPATLYALKGYKVDVSQGPDQFGLTYTAPNLGALLDESAETVAHNLAYDLTAKEYSIDELEKMLIQQINQDVAAYRHSKEKGESESYTFSILSLPSNLNPEQFYTHSESGAFSPLLYVQFAVLRMPDYPAVPNPKSGLVEGTSKGTQVVFKAYDDGYLRCVSVYDKNDNLILTAFVNPGSNARVRIPKGAYTFVFGTGTVWYGPENLFGEYGYYSKSADNVPDSSYIITITLNVDVKGRTGNMDSSSLNYGDLVGQ